MRREPHHAAGFPDPQIQLPVLGTFHRFVKTANSVQGAAPETAEVDRQGRLLLAADVKTCATNPEPGCHRTGHRTLKIRTALCSHNPADIVCTGAFQCLDADADVISWDERVTINADDDVTPGDCDCMIQRSRCAPRRIFHHGDRCVQGCEIRCNAHRLITRWPDRNHHVNRSGVVLLQNALHGFGEVPFLIHHRHHDGDSRQVTHVNSGCEMSPGQV